MREPKSSPKVRGGMLRNTPSLYRRQPKCQTTNAQKSPVLVLTHSTAFVHRPELRHPLHQHRRSQVINNLSSESPFVSSESFIMAFPAHLVPAAKSAYRSILRASRITFQGECYHFTISISTENHASFAIVHPFHDASTDQKATWQDG